MGQTTSRATTYDVVTDRIMALLDKGTVPWRRPWTNVPGSHRPLNIRGTAYHGINRMVLSAMGYESPLWLTFKQAKELGGHIRKGEHGTPVVFWTFVDRDAQGDETDDETGRNHRSGILRYSTAFNLEQTEGIAIKWQPSPPPEVPAIDVCEAIVGRYSDAPALHHGGESACYRPSTDAVQMPPRAAFATAEAYYGTLFHELGHSTGHSSRLARPGITDTNLFGSHEYSREELVAEITASFLCAEAGIDTPLIDNSAAYIASWLRALGNDKRMVVWAAGQAQRAADRILGTVANDAALAA